MGKVTEDKDEENNQNWPALKSPRTTAGTGKGESL